MFKPVEVKALPNYRIWVKYSDGVQGEVDAPAVAVIHLGGVGHGLQVVIVTAHGGGPITGGRPVEAP